LTKDEALTIIRLADEIYEAVYYLSTKDGQCTHRAEKISKLIESKLKEEIWTSTR